MKWDGVKLYHYTDYYAFEGIIKGKKLWLSNVRSMNDRKEMHYFMESLKNVLIRECQGKKTYIEELFQQQYTRLSDKQAYSASFSILRDDAAQWDRYGNKGTGVMICFDAKKLYDLVYDKVSITPVFYQNDISEHQIKGILKKYIENGYVSQGFKNIDEIFENAWASSTAYKHKSFEQEEEVRAVLLPFYDKFFGKEACYKMANCGIREYYPLKIEQDIIEEVMVGPNCINPEGVMERCLKSWDAENIRISYSSCPLR